MAVEMPLNGDEYHDRDEPGILPGGLSVELPHGLRFITDRAAEVNPSRESTSAVHLSDEPEPVSLKISHKGAFLK